MVSATASRNPPQSGFRYERHKPEGTALHQIIETHLPDFQRHIKSADVSLPHFVHSEFHSYLRCGLLKHGDIRVKCYGCRFEHLVVGIDPEA